MSTFSVEVIQNRATAEHVAILLTACDQDFSPPLSERQDITAYAQRIFTQAERFECWDAGQLIGLVAIYCNDPQKRLAFITNVSVLAHYRGQGIADALLQAAIAHAQKQEIFEIALEVDLRAAAAQALYKKHGFSLADQNETAQRLVRPLR